MADRGQARCTSCPQGKYSDVPEGDSLATCKLCGMGKYSSETGASEAGACQLCVAGKFSAAGFHDCSRGGL